MPDPLGPPPTTLDILVRTGDAIGRATVAIAPTDVQGYKNVDDIPAIGYLDIGSVAVNLHPQPPVSTHPVIAAARTLAHADVDGDGRDDLLVVSAYRIIVMHNENNGAFADGQQLRTDVEIDQVLPGDIDDDGDIDLVVMGYPNYEAGGVTLDTYTNTAGTFGNRTTRTLPTDYWASAYHLLDVDADGDLDVQLGADVFLNDGTGRFAAPVRLPHGSASLILADIDGDSRPDRITTDREDDTPFLRVSLNNGFNAFESTQAYPIAHQAAVLAANDVDADGDLDVIYWENGYDAGGAPHRIGVLHNDGNGILNDPVTYGMIPGADALAVGDFDQDGDADVATVMPGSPFNIAIHRNDGAGHFADYYFVPLTPPGTPTEEDYLADVLIADLDGIAPLDLAGLYSNFAAVNETIVLLNPTPPD
ncbi:MAG: VCBS repeat-containing protein [Phycisphaerales bacterium]|nr:VCBS repeat-containing protein [Phycisphaerales bacterium]